MLAPQSFITQTADYDNAVQMSTPCVEWDGAVSHGYGVVSWNGRRWRVHRKAWVEVHGPIPKGMVVMHLCNNQRCYRLNHLKLGTQLENVRQRDAEGRRVPLRGDRHGSTKISDAQVSEIRRRHARGERLVDLARVYGCTPGNIGHIVRGHSRYAAGHVPPAWHVRPRKA